MSHPSDSVAARLGPVARLRREQTPVRAVVAVTSAAGFAFGLPGATGWLWVWLAVYVLANGLEVWALHPFAQAETRPPSRLRTAVALAAIALLAGSFGAVSLLLVHAPGSLGAAAALLLLASGVLNVLSTSRGSGEAFIAGAAPYAGLAIWLTLQLGAGPTGRDPLSPVVALAVLTFILTAGLIWRDGDRTHRRERAANRELDDRRREAEEAWEARQAFIAGVSHELRTPLGAILAAGASLERAPLAPADLANAGLITDASRLMRRLLDDLLDLARLEAGRMEVEAQTFDPAALIRSGVCLWTATAAAKGLELEIEGAERLPRSAVGDPLRLRQVLNNLLSNALKFTSAGRVRVVCGAEPAGSEAWDVTLDVIDTGPGVPDEVIARLFRPFTQAGPQTARLHGGSGLGLAISRELARAMGGSLAARRGAGGCGAVFTFRLRLGATAEAGEVAEAVASPPPRAAPPRLLVVDDHPHSRRALRVLLEVAGMDVSEADGGAAALEVMSARTFDLVLTDLSMPGIGGCEAVRRLRAGGGPNAGTPVLAVTGHTGPETLRACREAGMSGYVEKPCEPQALYDAVASALERPPPTALAA